MIDHRQSVKQFSRSIPGKILLCLLLLHLAIVVEPAVLAADDDDAVPLCRAKLFEESDQWLDLSHFLDCAYGFVPLVSPITEPAVGYGATVAAMFISRREPAGVEGYARPNLAIVGALATENGTRGLFAAHLGTWRAGRLRTLVALMDAELHLEFFGLGGDRPPSAEGADYTVRARGGAAGGSYRFGSKPIFAGLRYAKASTRVDLPENARSVAPAIPQEDLDLDLVALTPSVTLDTRDNLFTPTRGWYLDLAAPIFRRSLGSDRDFERAAITAMHFRPLAKPLFFGVRATARTSSDGTPFFLRPFVLLRGVAALGYQGEQAAELEAELRWQFHRRISLVGFAGAGAARSELAGDWQERSVATGGVGGRYLLARQHGLHMGLDLAFGPDEPVIYLVFGSAWMRP